MAEYIEREALLEDMTTTALPMDAQRLYLAMRGKVRNAPAADVVEVVRCKDCIHWGCVAFGNICRRWSAPIAGTKNRTRPDDFCSCGEREDDAE